MKQLLAFVLLTVFLYSLVGFYPAYLWRQHEFREQAEHLRRARLPNAALVQVRVARTPGAAAALQWQEPNEFRWRGQLYDVVRQCTAADSITYFCWHDQAEEKLLAGLQTHVDALLHPDQRAGKTAKKLLDHLFKLAFLGSPAQLVAASALRPVSPCFPVVGAAVRRRPTTVVPRPPELAVTAS